MSTPAPTPLRHHRPVPFAPTQGTLALDLAPVPDPGPPRLHGVVSEVAGTPATGRADVVPIDAHLHRQLEGWCRRYAQAVIEIVGGDRPATQVVRWTAPDVYADLHRRAQLVSRAGVHQSGLAGPRPSGVRPTVRSARIAYVDPGVAEVALHLRYGERSRALAARFELLRSRWLCTALDFA